MSSLYGDEFSNAARTQRTAIYFLYELFSKTNFSYFDHYQFKHLVHFLSFIELLFLVVIIILIQKKNFLSIFILILLTIFFRKYLMDFGMHPPLNHSISFIFTSLFGFNDYIFRFSYLTLFIIGYIFLYKQLKNLVTFKINYLLILSFFTIPLGFLSSTNVDHSIWGHIFLINFLVYYHFNKSIDYKKLVLIISLFSMARITIFATIVPVFIDYIFYKKGKIDFKEIVKIFFPIIFFLPFILKTILLGSNVHTGSASEIFYELLYKIEEFKILSSTIIFNPLHVILLSLIGLFFFIKKKNFLKIINISILFIIYFLIYSSIEETFLGHPKYVFEYTLPYIIFLIIIFFTGIKNFRIYTLITLILINLFFINNFQTNKITLENSTIHFIRDRHDYKSAFKTVYMDQKQNSTLLLGLNYGFVTQILNKYSVRESVNIRNKNLQMRNDLIKNKNKNIYNLANDNNEIDSVIIDKYSFERYKKNFTKWKLIDEFSYPKNKDSSIIYLRKIN
ncbi:hypothetical protein OAM22_00785 [Candidatus Pelagibacter sp.]|nr:hypothetical protein [Candidatus Pelagibacter sp.]